MKEIKVKCKHDFQVWDMLENVLEGEFVKDEIYTAELDEETQEYYIKGETDMPVAHYDINDALIMGSDFELVEYELPNEFSFKYNWKDKSSLVNIIYGETQCRLTKTEI